MNFLNLDLSKTYASPAFTGAEPIQRATWFCLACYCAIQENGGRIVGCKDWGERRWPQEAKVFKIEVEATIKSGLVSWEGDDLVVFAYPAEQEAALVAKRSGGKLGWLARAAKHSATHATGQTEGHHAGQFKDSQKESFKDSQKDSSYVKERKGKEIRTGGIQPQNQTGSGSFPTIKKVQVKDYSTIHDPKHDPIDLASSITGDWSEMGRAGWRKDLVVLAQDGFRKVLETVWGEQKAGEPANNWAAILSVRLKKARIAKAAPPGVERATA